ncbi:NAD(P)/FAD-dependent oxidoreductase [Dactylosporangium sp. CA-092794]|uniref:NAD(P)/FAD-dependent oxidoreductase n=1 Tax=Dactylosporangium sp. CA-092794 TaxID=3239929 RepID=UPI003D946239
MSTPATRHTAIVIGAGIAGLAAARVLADRFPEVIVLDRDELPDSARPRKGVPQGQHSHILLAAGQQALEQIFPGLLEELRSAGALDFDSGRDLHLYRLGAAWAPVTTGLPFVSLTRPLLEYTMRQQLRRRPQVRFLAATAVSALTGSGDRIGGVRLDDGRTLDADLVVDASGRGSRSDRWLADLGWAVPALEEVKVYVGYVSRLYRRTPGDLGVPAAFVQPTPPAGKRIGAALAVEDDRWLVSVGGWHGEYPAADETGFALHAESLPDPVIAELTRKAEPLSEPVGYSFPSNRRRRFEELEAVPGGYVTVGDAVCSFNPLYGQGMTVAAQSALALGRIVDLDGPFDADRARQFYRDAAGIALIPWLAALSGDFDYAQTTGTAPPAAALFSRYSTQVQLAAQVSGTVRAAVLRVQHLLAPPTSLWLPDLVAEVARQARHAEPDAEPAFGHGAFGRPLWTEHDRHAERIRHALRTAGLPELTDEQAGFAVEGGAPILAASLDNRAADYVEPITAAGYGVTADPQDPLLLLVEPR